MTNHDIEGTSVVVVNIPNIIDYVQTAIGLTNRESQHAASSASKAHITYFMWLLGCITFLTLTKVTIGVVISVY